MAFRSPDATVPAFGAASVTPNDSTDIATCRSVYVGGAGAMKVTMADDTTVTFSGLLAGAVYPFQAKRIWSTGTTATNIVALY